MGLAVDLGHFHQMADSEVASAGSVAGHSGVSWGRKMTFACRDLVPWARLVLDMGYNGRWVAPPGSAAGWVGAVD